MLDRGQRAIGTDEPEKEKAIGQDPIVKDFSVGNGKPQTDFKWVLDIICVLEKQRVERLGRGS